MTELYLYQTVHLARGCARNVEAHVAVLDAASRELFGRRYAPGAARRAARIEALAAAERYPTGVSGFVRIERGADGEERLVPAGVSLYDGYAFRSLTPEAVTLCYELPLTAAPTSAREAAAQLARRMAEQAGADIAVRCDREGILREADDAPLFASIGSVMSGSAVPHDEDYAFRCKSHPSSYKDVQHMAGDVFVSVTAQIGNVIEGVTDGMSGVAERLNLYKKRHDLKKEQKLLKKEKEKRLKR